MGEANLPLPPRLQLHQKARLDFRLACIFHQSGTTLSEPQALAPASDSSANFVVAATLWLRLSQFYPLTPNIYLVLTPGHEEIVDAISQLNLFDAMPSHNINNSCRSPLPPLRIAISSRPAPAPAPIPGNYGSTGTDSGSCGRWRCAL